MRAWVGTTGAMWASEVVGAMGVKSGITDPFLGWASGVMEAHGQVGGRVITSLPGDEL